MAKCSQRNIIFAPHPYFHHPSKVISPGSVSALASYSFMYEVKVVFLAPAFCTEMIYEDKKDWQIKKVTCPVSLPHLVLFPCHNKLYLQTLSESKSICLGCSRSWKVILDLSASRSRVGTSRLPLLAYFCI